MGVRGIDISNHQSGMDVERVVRDNAIGFVFILSNDGTFKNTYYASQATAARRGGATVVPYVYLRTNVDQTFATFRQQVPTPGPVIVDVEDGSGGVAECRRIHDLLHAAGYTTPFLYWPDWYRKKIGSPSLAGFPPLWTSWYPDNTSRGFDAGLSMLPAWVWNGYGGLPTRIVQFTSSGRLSGYGANLDLNYFPGSREELDALLLGKDSDMPLTPNDGNTEWAAADPFTGKVEKRSIAAWIGLSAFYGLYANQRIAKLEGVVAGLTTLVTQAVANDQDIDLAAIEAAAERGAREGTAESLKSLPVEVDINLAGDRDTTTS